MIKDTRNSGKEKKELDLEDPRPAEGGETVIDEALQDGDAPGVGAKEAMGGAASPAGLEALDEKSLLDELKLRDSELEKKKEEMEALKDILKRRQADFENYKKRMAKSQEELRRMVIKDMALDIITINDDLLRAVEASGDIGDDRVSEAPKRAFRDGIRMISRQIEEMLKKYGVVEIESLNREFDPALNEAVEIEESDGVDKDTITKVYQKGFMIDDYIVRCARVKVARKVRPRGEPGGSEGDGGRENRENEERVQ